MVACTPGTNYIRWEPKLPRSPRPGSSEGHRSHMTPPHTSCPAPQTTRSSSPLALDSFFGWGRVLALFWTDSPSFLARDILALVFWDISPLWSYFHIRILLEGTFLGPSTTQGSEYLQAKPRNPFNTCWHLRGVKQHRSPSSWRNSSRSSLPSENSQWTAGGKWPPNSLRGRIVLFVWTSLRITFFLKNQCVRVTFPRCCNCNGFLNAVFKGLYLAL
jgi:hypothetical protein